MGNAGATDNGQFILMSNSNQEVELDIFIARLAATKDGGEIRPAHSARLLGEEKLKGPGHLCTFENFIHSLFF